MSVEVSYYFMILRRNIDYKNWSLAIQKSQILMALFLIGKFWINFQLMLKQYDFQIKTYEFVYVLPRLIDLLQNLFSYMWKQMKITALVCDRRTYVTGFHESRMLESLAL